MNACSGFYLCKITLTKTRELTGSRQFKIYNSALTNG